MKNEWLLNLALLIAGGLSGLVVISIMDTLLR